MSLNLSSEDFNQIVTLLAAIDEFQGVQGRIDFMKEVFAGSPRAGDIRSLINYDGPPRSVAVRVVSFLVEFGQDVSGRETLGLLINKMLAIRGFGQDADFLRNLFSRYPLHTEPIAGRALDEWRGHETESDVQEKIIGENTLRDVRILELALEASRAVMRIRTPTSLGTGFLGAQNLLFTCNHVLPTRSAAEDSEYQLNFQLNKQGLPMDVSVCRAQPNGLFYTNPSIDFTVVELQALPLPLFPLVLMPEPVRKDERVNIIQHPGGNYKKISMQNNFVAYADAQIIQYLTSTEPGSSGAPVFNNLFGVVGIHHSGGNLPEPNGPAAVRYLRNEGSTMIAVLRDLQQNAPEIFRQLKV